MPRLNPESVRGLSIVGDSALVRGFEAVANLDGDRKGVVDRERAFRHPIGERRAFDELHHDDHRVAVKLDAEHLGDRCVIERSEHLGLSLESRAAVVILERRSREDFERDIALEAGVTRAKHLAHAPDADGADDFIRTDPLSRNERHSGGV